MVSNNELQSNHERGQERASLLRSLRNRPRVLVGIGLLIALGVLAACGGGGGSTGAPETTMPPGADPTIINGITVPPDPGAAGNATVVGIDTDTNGIRDDVDRLIATKYGTNADSLKAARLSARGFQAVLAADKTSQDASRTALQESARAGGCAGDGFRAAGLVASQQFNILYTATNNTPERLAHRKSVSAKAGLFTDSITSDTCP